jgi:hypothetical protein
MDKMLMTVIITLCLLFSLNAATIGVIIYAVKIMKLISESHSPVDPQIEVDPMYMIISSLGFNDTNVLTPEK